MLLLAVELMTNGSAAAQEGEGEVAGEGEADRAQIRLACLARAGPVLVRCRWQLLWPQLCEC